MFHPYPAPTSGSLSCVVQGQAVTLRSRSVVSLTAFVDARATKVHVSASGHKLTALLDLTPQSVFIHVAIQPIGGCILSVAKDTLC